MYKFVASVILLFAICLNLVSAVAAPDKRREDQITRTTANFGGPHGYAFDDFSHVNKASGHRRIASIKLGPCVLDKHISSMEIEFKDFAHPDKANIVVEHRELAGKYSKKTSILKLDQGDYITHIDLKTYLHDSGWASHTRIGYMYIETLNGKSIECGAHGKKDTDKSWDMVKGQAFLYFSGAQGAGIDNLTGHFINSEDY